MPYLAEPKDPIREVLQQMLGAEPPDFVRGYSLTQLSDQDYEALQDWVGDHYPIGWETNIGLLDAAEIRVQEAVMNGNIPPPPDGARFEYTPMHVKLVRNG